MVETVTDYRNFEVGLNVYCIDFMARYVYGGQGGECVGLNVWPTGSGTNRRWVLVERVMA